MGPDGRGDYLRGWILAACWVCTSVADIYYLYHLVRRPLLILDFTLTLLFDHLVLTTYYYAVILTSLFFWNVVLGSIILTLLPSRRAYVREKRNVRGPYDRNKQPRFRRR